MIQKTLKRLQVLIPAFLLCLAIQAQEATTYVEHVVEKGQTLFSIGQMYGVSVDVLSTLNPSAKVLHPGDRLRIPSSGGVKGKFHTVKTGETLYRLGVDNGISAVDIVKANPGLNIDSFKAGQVIFIPAPKENAQETTPQPEAAAAGPATQNVTPATPQFNGLNGQSMYMDMHKVKKGETLYSIARSYNLTQEEILAVNPGIKDGKVKKNSFLRIPYPKPSQEESVKQQEQANEKSNLEVFQSARKDNEARYSTIKAAVILPFLDKNGNKTQETERMVEYYEGLLMAVDSLKREGDSMDIRTYNSGSTAEDISAILKRPEIQDIDIIFGPLHGEQIPATAQFAKDKGVRLVIPFTSRDNNVFQNPMIYQVNTPQSYLYSEVYDHFLKLFPTANVVFTTMDLQATDKTDFIEGFRQELTRRNLSYKELAPNTNAQTFKAALKDDVPNIIVPTSGNNLTLLKTLPLLASVSSDSLNTAETHLFGYPEYQTYTSDHLSSFFEQDTYFYSSFYTNNLLQAARNFITSYRRWYGKDMEERYPRYGMLGFDTGYYFLKGLSRYGDTLEEHLKDFSVTPIQTGFKFERVNNWGGFVNKKAFFVHFTKDFELIKMDFE